jgi:hypothetical protein
MAVTLTEEEKQRMEHNSTDDLTKMVVGNERKRRKINDDKKAYAAACKDMTDMIEAQTKYALEILEKREIEAGIAKAPGHKPIVPFADAMKQKAKKEAEKAAKEAEKAAKVVAKSAA